MAELVYALDLGSSAHRAWGFESPLSQRIQEGRMVMAEYTLEVKKEELDKKIKELAEKYRKDVMIPGFRKGRAPVELIKVRFSRELEAEGFQEIAGAKLEEILEKHRPFIYAGPDVLDVKKDEEKGNITLKVGLEVPPEIGKIDYKKLSRELPGGEVTEKDIEKELEKLREINAELKPVKRKIKKGDSVLVDIEMGDVKMTNYSLDIGNDTLSRFIKGMKAGEEKKEEIEFPEKFSIPELAGKKGEIKVKVLDVKEKVLPEIDDEFAKNMGFENLDDMKKEIRAQLEEDLKENLEKKIREKILDNLIEQFDIEPPESLVRSLSVNMTRADAEKEAKRIAILDAIALKEKIEITDEDIDRKLNEVAEGKIDEEKLPGYRDNLRPVLIREKTIEFLIKKVRGEDGDN